MALANKKPDLVKKSASLPVHVNDAGDKRRKELGLSWSHYIRLLVSRDLAEHLIVVK